MDNLNWDSAKVYLNEFKLRFPDDQADILAADYQLALIAYKQGQSNAALEGFKAILSIYENDVSGSLYEWVEVLSEKLVARLEPPTPDSEPEPAPDADPAPAPDPAPDAP